MVITEDEYLDFLVNTSRDESLIPPRIKMAFTGTTLLFLGFRLADLEFRVLLRSLANHLRDSLARGSHVSAQFIQAGKHVTAAHLAEAQEYLTNYYGNAPFNIKVYWGTTQEFLSELREYRSKFYKHGL
jgi:SIR2-like domain